MHAARAAATLWPRAARAKGPGQGKLMLVDKEANSLDESLLDYLVLR